jgi:hypothetical protein
MLSLQKQNQHTDFNGFGRIKAVNLLPKRTRFTILWYKNFGDALLLVVGENDAFEIWGLPEVQQQANFFFGCFSNS